jgi:hypothetical protein
VGRRQILQGRLIRDEELITEATGCCGRVAATVCFEGSAEWIKTISTYTFQKIKMAGNWRVASGCSEMESIYIDCKSE